MRGIPVRPAIVAIPQPWRRAGVVDRLLETLGKELVQRGKGGKIIAIAL